MVNFGLLNVSIVDENGRAYKERIINGQNFVIAELGQEYCVKVTISRDLQSNKFPAPLLRVGLFVDGQDVNYWKRLDVTSIKSSEKSISTLFWGFKKNNSDLNAFKFEKPGLGKEAQVGAVDLMYMGKIRVIVFEALLTAGVFDNNSGTYSEVQRKAVSENKKFWEQASATTTSGRRIDETKEKFTPVNKWLNKTKTPLFDETISYHTSDVLDLLGLSVNTTAEQRSSSSNSSNSKDGKRPSETKNDVNANKRACNETRGSSVEPHLSKSEPEVKYVPVVSEIPFLDLTSEDCEEERRWEIIKQIK